MPDRTSERLAALPLARPFPDISLFDHGPGSWLRCSLSSPSEQNQQKRNYWKRGNSLYFSLFTGKRQEKE